MSAPNAREVCWLLPHDLDLRLPEGYRLAGPALHLGGLSAGLPGRVVTLGDWNGSTTAPVVALLIVSSVLLRVFAGGKDDQHAGLAFARRPLLVSSGESFRVALDGCQRWVGEVWVWPLGRVVTPR